MSKKKILFSLMILIILVIATLFIALTMLDSIAKTSIEKGATYALDVKTTLDKIHIGLLTGQIDMNNLTIDNPSEFKSRHLMKINELDVEIKPASLFSDTIHIRKFILDGLDVNIDQKLTANNVSVILNNIKRLSSKEEQEDKQKTGETQEGKKIFVNTITVNNVVAHFNLDANLASKNITVKIPTIVLKDVSSEDSPIVIRQLVMKLIPAILIEIIKQSKGLAPDDILNQLNSQIVNIQGKIIKSVISKSAEQTEKAIKQKAENAFKNIINKTKTDKKGTTEIISNISGKKIQNKSKMPEAKSAKKVEQNIKKQGNALFNNILKPKDNSKTEK